MSKLFKFFMFFTIPLLAGIMVSCGDDAAEEEVMEPSITSVSPEEGFPGTVVTISGTNLEDVSEVRFGATDAEGFNSANNTATSITATVPAGIAAGAQNITVVSPGGEDTFLFTVLQEEVTLPVITSFAPMSGAVGDEVTVSGTDLDLATSATLGGADITDWSAATDGMSATFTVPDGAVTGPIVLMTAGGDEVSSNDNFTVDSGNEPGTELVVSTDVVVHAQGDRNDGVPTAFSAEGQTYTIQEGTEEGVGAEIDFIAADSGGDNELDLFSPNYDELAGDDWLADNYFEDDDDLPIEWSTLNSTQMRLITEEDAIDFENVTVDQINALEITEPVYRVEILPENIGAVIFFITAEGEKGLLHYKASDLNPEKLDQFTFDIKVVQ